MRSGLKALSVATMLSMGLFSPVETSASNLDEGEIVYSYDRGYDATTYGTAKKETYDVAMLMQGDNLVGKTITKVIVPMEGVGGIVDFSVWMAKELALDDDKNNVCDLSIQVEELGDTIEVVLPEPYTITDGGVYVGYSFAIDSLGSHNRYPIYIVSEYEAGGFFLHSSRTYRSWVDKSESLGNLCMQVMVSGVEANSAGVSLPQAVNTQADTPFSTSITVANHGWQGVGSFEYSYEINGQTGSASIDLGDEALGAIYGASTTLDISLPAVGENGSFPLTVTITKVNGEENTDQEASAVCTIKSYEVLPTHRAVMEEYTGTWCGYCPRGFVAMKLMADLYPDQFIGLAYHNGDPMEVMSLSDYPSSVSGFPEAYLDRAISVDPYYGSGSEELGVKDDWLLRCDELSPADVDVVATIDDEETAVEITATFTFPVGEDDANYEAEFVLMADSLSGESSDWAQVNYYYSGYSFSYDEFSVFTSGDYYVYGLYYNDVVLATSRLNADGNTPLPSAIEGMEAVNLSYTQTLDAGWDAELEEVVRENIANLKVAVLLIDSSTGEIVNANAAKVTKTTSAGIETESTKGLTSEDCQWFDLSGRRLAQPSKGINLMKTASGETRKTVVR